MDFVNFAPGWDRLSTIPWWIKLWSNFQTWRTLCTIMFHIFIINYSGSGLILTSKASSCCSLLFFLLLSNINIKKPQHDKNNLYYIAIFKTILCFSTVWLYLKKYSSMYIWSLQLYVNVYPYTTEHSSSKQSSLGWVLISGELWRQFEVVILNGSGFISPNPRLSQFPVCVHKHYK